MPGKRITMSTIKEIRRLKNLGHSKTKVARLLKLNRETVIKYWEASDDVDIEKIPKWVKELDWKLINQEINSKVPRKILYEELKETFELPSYQAFCKYIKNHKKSALPEVTLKIARNPGDSLEVDYSGDSVSIVNPSTGELVSTELFVGSLSFSGDFYCEFTPSQRLNDFIRSHINTFEYFGGVTSFIIPDNCKTAITKNKKYDSEINKTYQDMCEHYQLSVDPADPYSPRHKPNVENAVGIIQKDFIPRIRNKTFYSLGELNRELKKWLLNKRQDMIKGRGKSRAEFFEIERKYLKQLPENRYELFSFKKAKVHPDCHFQHQKNFYSVPHQYVGQEIDIKFNDQMVHAYYQCELVTSHKTAKGTYHYSTNTAHYPEKKYVDANYHLALLKRESRAIGPNTGLLFEKLIAQSCYPLKIIRKLQGILKLAKKYEKEAMEHAAGLALEFNRLNYDHINRFAKHYKKEQPKEVTKAPLRQPSLICLQGGVHE